MNRSSKPLALSLVTLTEPGDVKLTFDRITEFDDREFGFNHNRTWAAMPKALRGIMDPDAVERSFVKEHKRVQNCITALCQLGKKLPLNTFAFADFPDAKLRSVQSIDWDPEVTVRVKASCWFVQDGRAHIPLLQPRKNALSPERLALYVKLGRQAYCKGDWTEAVVDLIDLSGDESPAASFVDLTTLPQVTDRDLREFVQTYVEAKRMADAERVKRPKRPVILPMDELLLT